MTLESLHNMLYQTLELKSVVDSLGWIISTVALWMAIGCGVMAIASMVAAILDRYGR